MVDNLRFWKELYPLPVRHWLLLSGTTATTAAMTTAKKNDSNHNDINDDNDDDDDDNDDDNAGDNGNGDEDRLVQSSHFSMRVRENLTPDRIANNAHVSRFHILPNRPILSYPEHVSMSSFSWAVALTRPGSGSSH